jgi:hypothetical protein
VALKGVPALDFRALVYSIRKRSTRFENASVSQSSVPYRPDKWNEQQSW